MRCSVGAHLGFCTSLISRTKCPISLSYRTIRLTWRTPQRCCRAIWSATFPRIPCKISNKKSKISIGEVTFVGFFLCSDKNYFLKECTGVQCSCVSFSFACVVQILRESAASSAAARARGLREGLMGVFRGLRKMPRFMNSPRGGTLRKVEPSTGSPAICVHHLQVASFSSCRFCLFLLRF